MHRKQKNHKIYFEKAEGLLRMMEDFDPETKLNIIAFKL